MHALRLIMREQPSRAQDLVPDTSLHIGRLSRWNEAISCFEGGGEAGVPLFPHTDEKVKHCSRRQAGLRICPDGSLALTALGMNALSVQLTRGVAPVLLRKGEPEVVLQPGASFCLLASFAASYLIWEDETSRRDVKDARIRW